MKSKNAFRCTLPSYNETRFYSLSQLFHTVNLFFDIIKEYGESWKNADSFWTTFKLHGKKIYENRVVRLKMVIEREGNYL